MDLQFWLGFPAGEKSPKKVKVFSCRRNPAKNESLLSYGGLLVGTLKNYSLDSLELVEKNP